MKKVVYTVMLGKEYDLKEPKYENKSWILKCFTNRNIKSKNWEIVKLKDFDDPRKKSREVKIANHRFFNYDICLYLDARFTIQTDLDSMVEKYLKSDIAVMTRKRREFSYQEEIELCIKLNLDNEKILKKQLGHYKKEGLPENSRLYSPGIMFKRNSEEVKNFMELWYNEIENHSYRDIVSFAYTIWKNPMNISVMPHRPTYKLFMNYGRK